MPKPRGLQRQGLRGQGPTADLPPCEGVNRTTGETRRVWRWEPGTWSFCLFWKSQTVWKEDYRSSRRASWFSRGRGGGRYVWGTIEMALVWEPAQALACYRFPLTLRQSPLPVLAPHMEPGGPKPLSGGLTRGIPSGEGRRAWRGLLLEWGPSLSHVQGL